MAVKQAGADLPVADPQTSRFSFKRLEWVVDAVRKYATTLPTMRSKLEEIEQSQREILKAVKPYTDPEIVKDIRMLKQTQTMCENKAKQFFKACFDMALFARNDVIVEAIDQDLMNGQVTALIEFVTFFCKHIDKCQQYLKRFTEVQERAQQSAEAHMSKYKLKEHSSKQELELAKQEHADIFIKDGISSVTSGAATMAISVTAADKDQNLAILATMIASVTSLSRAYQLKLAGDALKAEQQIEECTKQEQIFKIAQKCVQDLHKEMCDVRDYVDTMWTHAEQAHDNLTEVEESLVTPRTAKLSQVQTQYIKENLGSIHRSMVAIQKQQEEDITHVRLPSDPALSNTQVHPTDNSEAGSHFVGTLNMPENLKKQTSCRSTDTTADEDVQPSIEEQRTAGNSTSLTVGFGTKYSSKKDTDYISSSNDSDSDEIIKMKDLEI